MTAVLQDTWAMAWRDLRRLLRQPWWIAATLVQPVVWLLLYGELFSEVVRIPGFAGDDYVAFLLPGIVVMAGLFTNGWSGVPTIDDMNRGVIDRFLITPVRRGPLLAGRLLQGALGVTVQALVLVVLAVATGSTLGGGPLGVAALIVVACLLGFGFGAISNALALLIRREETVIAVANFLMLPLIFLSTAFMQASLVPDWIADVARFNPVNWAVEAGRAAVEGSTDWGFVAERAGLLAAFALLACWLATRAFGAYQRSV